jgi:hypothetical protein
MRSRTLTDTQVCRAIWPKEVLLPSLGLACCRESRLPRYHAFKLSSRAVSS